MLRFLVLATCFGIATSEALLPCHVGRYMGFHLFDLRQYEDNYTFCTHLVLDHVRLIAKEGYQFAILDDKDAHFYEYFNATKAKHPELKTILSFGGPETESWVFSSWLKSGIDVSEFIRYATSLGFDGIDIAFFYPSAADKARFADFLNELRAHSKGRLIITATVSGDPRVIKNSYDVIPWIDSVDFINVQSYGYHDKKYRTGLLSPMFSSRSNNVMDTLDLWAKLGVPPEKIVMGVSSYGYGYLLDDPENNKVGAPAHLALPIHAWLPPGVIPYRDIHKVRNENTTDVYVEEGNVYYFVNETMWVSYEKPESIVFKMQFVKENDFGGAYINALEYDYQGHTGLNFPLLRAMKKGLAIEYDYPTDAPEIKTTPEPSYTICNPRLPIYYPWAPDLDDCKQYYYCDGIRPYKLSCAEGLYWDAIHKKCYYWNNNCMTHARWNITFG
uniref:Chitin-binding type-2 domain-containing protein n=1 Tax=Panagrellus redivivus TaxID=6233 RepID=A0A7E4UPC7_PANRE